MALVMSWDELGLMTSMRVTRVNGGLSFIMRYRKCGI